MPKLRDYQDIRTPALILQQIPSDHAHLCACGTTLECSRADCAVSDPYECPSCERDRQDEYFTRQEQERNHESQ